MLKEEDGLDISQLADRCHLLKPSLTRIVQNLELRALISREGSESDHRRSVLFLSDSGTELFEQVAPKSEDRYRHITEKFGFGKLELLYELLDELVEKIDGEDNGQ